MGASDAGHQPWLSGADRIRSSYAHRFRGVVSHSRNAYIADLSLLISATARTQFTVSLPVAFGFSLACDYLAKSIPYKSIAGQAIHSAMLTGSYVCFFIVGIEVCAP